MKYYILQRWLSVLSICTIFTFASCEFNPANVTNPQITEQNLLANADGGSAGLIQGLRRRFANAVSVTCTITELASDDYKNTTSFVSAELDAPRGISQADLTLNLVGTGAYFQLLQTHALADFGLKVVAVKDKFTTEAQKAEMRLYKGLAILMLSENWTAFPLEDQGSPLTAAAARKLAIEQFTTAFAAVGQSTIATDRNIANACRAALARAYRMEGDKTNAEKFAKDLLAAAPTYLFQAQFDVVQWKSDYTQHMYVRSDNNFQPLPRCDFLDPKYTTEDAPIPVLKAEEMHLILAEIALSNNSLDAARKSMADAATLARSRVAITYTDRDNRKSNRPGAFATVMSVRADANSPYVNGLVQPRNNRSVTAYPTSFTNQTADSINSLSTADRTAHIGMLYLLRQHIFWSEARRMSDLGIRLPVSQRQSQTNKNFPENTGPGCSVLVPAYIPASDEMDRFTPAVITATTTQVTCLWDMNKILAANIRSVSPFTGF